MGVLLQAHKFHDVLVLDVACSRKHVVEEAAELLIGESLEHQWKHLVEFIEVGRHDVCLIHSVKPVHLGVADVNAVRIVWVNQVSPNFCLHLGVWQRCHTSCSASVSLIGLIFTEDHFHCFHLDIILEVS